MIELLSFVFQSFWHWFGSFLILCVCVQGAGWVTTALVAGIFGGKK